MPISPLDHSVDPLIKYLWVFQKIFDISKEIPCFSKPGDQIIFYPITLKEHENIKILVDAGVYQMESEVIDG